MDSSSVPHSSKNAVPISAWRTTRTTPSSSFRFNVETITSRSERPIRRWDTRDITVMTVIKPRPPNWMRSKITACPKKDHVWQVSTMTSPVTQVAEVAVNNAVKSPTLSPLRVEMGRLSSSVPSRMMPPKERATSRVALNRRDRISLSCINRVSRSSKIFASFPLAL